MRAVDIIIKKREKQTLTKEELAFFIEGLSSGEIPDYQVSSWAMAVLLNGMTDQETTDLTLAMAASGEVLDLSEIAPIVVDKHSTGGVGDKTTLAVGPIVASCGLPVGKMSGRGLGFSGGTIDKMESIPGYRVDLSEDEFLSGIADRLPPKPDLDTERVARAVFKLLAHRISDGEVRDIKGMLPKEIAGLWPHPA